MKKYLNSYFARPFDIYNALGNYNTYKSGLSQGKVILYKGTEQIIVDESEVPGYIDDGWSQKPPAVARKILQFMPDYTIRFADSNRVWRLYGNEADAINTYLLKWCNNPDLPYADKYKLMINNILMYNRNTNFSFEELKALYILDHEGFKDYVTGKPMSFLDILYYNIYGIYPKHYRHYDGKWNEIPLGKGIDYNFVEGDVASDSQLLFLGQLSGAVDLEVLAKIALEVEIMVVTNYIFAEAAILYLGRAIYGEAIALDLYRAGRLKTAMNFAKTFSSAVSSFEYIDDVGRSFDDVDNVLNYEVQIVNAEGKVITKAVAEAVENITRIMKGSNVAELANYAKKITVFDDYAEFVTKEGTLFKIAKNEVPEGNFTKLNQLITEFDEIDEVALAAYNNIRNRGLDSNIIRTIANNTGLSETEVSKLIQHVFINKHLIPQPGGIIVKNAYFTPDAEIAYAFKSAENGSLSLEGRNWFRQYANHELAEFEYELAGHPYRTIESWDSVKEIFTGNPPGAHDLSPKFQPTDPFPGYQY